MVRSDLARRVQLYCARAFPEKENVQLSSLVSLGAGWESDVYVLTLEHGPEEARQHEEVVARVYFGDSAWPKATREFNGLVRLYQAGYPVPRVHILERMTSPFGKPMILMDRARGQLLWPMLSQASGVQAEALLSLFCRLFVQLHCLDWRPFTDEPQLLAVGDPYVVVERELGRWWSVVAQLPVPGFVPVLEWLEARRRIPCLRPSPVHWDFHPGNILVNDDGAATVIDWTGIDVSDSRFDLAWTLVLALAYEGPTVRDAILAEYERLAGVPVEELAFFEAAACFRRLYSVVVSLTYGAERLGMRPGAEAEMRTHVEPLRRVHDLLVAKTGIRVPEVERLFAQALN